MTLRLVVDADGCRIADPPNLALEPLRRAARRDGAYAPEVCRWVDDWADAHGLVEALDDRGVSLWWFIRPHMAYQLQELLPDIEALGAAAAQAGVRAIHVDGFNPYWKRVATIVARTRGLSLQVESPPTSYRMATLGRRLATAAVLGARALMAIRRGRRPPGQARVAALVYSVCKRVTWHGRVRHLEPTFEPILLELERRGEAPLKLSAPSVNGWAHEWRWLRYGDRNAIPIELSFAVWLSRGIIRRRDTTRITLCASVDRVVPTLLAASVEWRGYDVTPEIHAFVRGFLAPRVRRAARDIRFFDHVLRKTKPKVLLFSDEYAGLAMAAIAAARRVGISTMAVQHGVIWRGHPGYTLPKARAATMPIPDRFCVFGAFDRELISAHGPYASEQIVVTGSPRFDLIVNQAPRVTRAALAALLGVEETAPLILFTSTSESHMLAVRLADFVAKSRASAGMLIKLHPLQEQDPTAFEVVARFGSPVRVRIIREEFDLYDLLRLVDVHMSMNSTVLSEAAAFDRPNIMLLTDVAIDTVRYVDRGVAVRAEDYPSLSEAVEDVLQGPAAARLREGRKAFVAAHFHRIDGQSTGRAADLVTHLLGARP